MLKWYKNLKIIHKTIILSIFVFSTLVSIFTLIFVGQTTQIFESSMHEDIMQKTEVVQVDLQKRETEFLTIATLLARMDVVKKAYVIENQKEVSRYMNKNIKPILNEIYKRTKMNPNELTFHFHRKGSVSLWRSWNGKGGDSLKNFRATVNQVQATHKPLMAIELGKVGFAIRGLVPVFDNNGKILGSLEVFSGVSTIMDRFSDEKGGTEKVGALFLANKSLAEKTFAKDVLKTKSLGEYKGFLVIGKWGDWIDSQKILMRMRDAEDYSNSDKLQIYMNGTIMLGSIPFLDYSGVRVGQLLVVEDASGIVKQKNHLVFLNLIFGLVLSIILVVGVSVLIYVMLTKVLYKIKEKTDNIVSGKEKADLTKLIDHTTNDEIGQVVKGFNGVILRLNHDLWMVKQATLKISEFSVWMKNLMTTQVHDNLEEIKNSIQQIDGYTEGQTAGIEQVNSTLEEMARNIESITLNVERQAASVEESASSIEEMNRNIEQTVQITRKTKDISTNLNNVAQEGGKAVRQSVKSIRDVSDYSQQILKMLKLITDISKQTNLLAMNASIEAAHAGDAGKGFAIVADEIRRLSENTNKGARDIGEVVNSIVDKIDESVNLAEKAGTGLEMIEAYSKQNVNIISHLNISMEEQDGAVKEILGAIQDMVQITEEIKTSMQEQKVGTDEFSETMRGLRDMALETKAATKKHIESTFSLIASIEEIGEGSQKNRNLIKSMNLLIDRFVLNEEQKSEQGEETEETSLKLVE